MWQWCIHDHLKYFQICWYQLCNAHLYSHLLQVPGFCHLNFDSITINRNSVLFGQNHFLFFMSSLTINAHFKKTFISQFRSNFLFLYLGSLHISTHNAPLPPATRKYDVDRATSNLFSLLFRIDPYCFTNCHKCRKSWQERSRSLTNL